MTDTTTQDSAVETEVSTSTETSTSWLDSLSEDYRGNDKIKTFETIDQFAESYINSQSLIGKKVEDYAVDVIAQGNGLQLFEKLKPSEASAYTVTDPNGNELNSDFLNVMREAAFESNMPKEMFEQMAGKYVQMEAAYAQEAEAQYNAAMQSLQNEWGEDYEANLAKSKAAAREYVPADYFEAFEQSYGNDPLVLKVFGDIATKMNIEDTTVTNAVPANSAEAIQTEINAITRDPNSAYWKSQDPAHKEAVAKVTELYTKLEDFKQRG